MRMRFSKTNSVRYLCKWNLHGFAITVALGLAMCCSGAFAQLSGKGAIRGTVTDRTGAVIPNATVAATNGATSILAFTPCARGHLGNTRAELQRQLNCLMLLRYRSPTTNSTL